MTHERIDACYWQQVEIRECGPPTKEPETHKRIVKFILNCQCVFNERESNAAFGRMVINHVDRDSKGTAKNHTPLRAEAMSA